jgi:hypothetical protein
MQGIDDLIESEHSQQDFAVEVSEQLKADFMLLREAHLYTSSDAQTPKFNEKTVDKFAQHIVCRHYGTLCYELSHLCWAIVNTGSRGALLDFFYVQENIKPKRFSTFFKGNAPCQIPQASVSLKAGEGAHSFLHISIHQHQFSLSAGRVNLLAACLEWLLNFVPNLLETLYEELNGKTFNAIQSLASTLQKHIYHYLNKHLPQAKVQAKFHFMSHWLNERQCASFDDKNILSFWQNAREREGMSRYTTVVRDIFQYQQALSSAQNASLLNNANELAEHIESEHVFDAIDAFVDQQICLEALTEVPKLLSKQQAEKLQLIADYPHKIKDFPLSLLRYIVFGQYQAKCIQAQRNQSLNVDSFTLSPLNEYDVILQHFAAQLKLNEQTWMAVLHILFSEDSADVLTVLTAKDNFLDLLLDSKTGAKEQVSVLQSKLYAPSLIEPSSSIKQGGGEIASGKGTASEIFADSEVLRSFKAMCKQSHARNNRQGFTLKSQLDDVSVYVDNTMSLLHVSSALQSVLLKNDALFKDLSQKEQNYQADGCILKDELMKRMNV